MVALFICTKKGDAAVATPPHGASNYQINLLRVRHGEERPPLRGQQQYPGQHFVQCPALVVYRAEDVLHLVLVVQQAHRFSHVLDAEVEAALLQVRQLFGRQNPFVLKEQFVSLWLFVVCHVIAVVVGCCGSLAMLGNGQGQEGIADLLAPEVGLVKSLADVLAEDRIVAGHQVTSGIVRQGGLNIECGLELGEVHVVVVVHGCCGLLLLTWQRLHGKLNRQAYSQKKFRKNETGIRYVLPRQGV